MELSELGVLDSLLSRQHTDGGWGYAGPVSWTEPTALVLLAFSTQNGSGEGFARGNRWLCGAQRSDGGWAPQAAVAESTWVTALAALVPSFTSALLERQSRGVDWLLRETGKESASWRRAFRALSGQRLEFDISEPGWPWFPGTAAWVMPTALTVLALENWQRRTGSGEAAKRIEQGRECLLSRTCRDGGWNYGTPRVLGVDADSYPDTTGAALLALHGVSSARMDRAIAAAEKHLARCQSVESRCWLAMGLAAQRRKPAPVLAPGLRLRGPMDTALWILAETALRGSNVFLGEGA